MATSQEKITLYNLADLKNTSDDAIPNYLNSLKFRQSHRLTDVRLGLGYTAFLIAAACFLWDWKLGFESTKYYTAGAVALYTVINGLLTLWIWVQEEGIIYVGTAPSGETVSIATTTRKNVPSYNLTIVVTPKSGTPQTLKVTRPFTDWFDCAGHFVATPFQSMLATAIPCVGKLDHKRVAESQSQSQSQPPSQSQTQSHAYYSDPDMLDALAAASVKATGADTPTGKKGGKRRKA